MAEIRGRFFSSEEERLWLAAAATLPASCRVEIRRSATSPTVEITIVRDAGESVSQAFADPTPEAVARFIKGSPYLKPNNR